MLIQIEKKLKKRKIFVSLTLMTFLKIAIVRFWSHAKYTDLTKLCSPALLKSYAGCISTVTFCSSLH
jgi:hypothetical protein